MPTMLIKVPGHGASRLRSSDAGSSQSGSNRRELSPRWQELLLWLNQTWDDRLPLVETAAAATAIQG